MCDQGSFHRLTAPACLQPAHSGVGTLDMAAHRPCTLHTLLETDTMAELGLTLMTTRDSKQSL